MRFQRIAIAATLLLLTTLLVLATIAPVAAGRGGVKGKPGGGGSGETSTPPSATLVVSPSPAPAYSTATLSGTGYVAGVQLWIEIEGGWCCVYTQLMPNADGSFSLGFGTRAPGTYEARVYQKFKGGKHDKGTLMGQTTFEVR